MQFARSAVTETYQMDRRGSKHRVAQQMVSPLVLQPIRFFYVIVLYSLASSAYAADNYLALRAGVLNGDYGTTVESTLSALTFTLGHQASRYDLSVSGQLLKLEVDGVSEQGVGDLYLRGGRLLLSEYESPIDLYSSLTIKLPTADETKGLGTGETDYGLYLSAAKYINRIKWSIYTNYTVIGEPVGVSYDNQFVYGLGLFKGFGESGVSASIERANAIVQPSEDDPTELHLAYMRWIGIDEIVGVSGFAGLNDGSADYAFNLEWLHLFR